MGDHVGNVEHIIQAAYDSKQLDEYIGTYGDFSMYFNPHEETHGIMASISMMHDQIYPLVNVFDNCGKSPCYLWVNQRFLWQ